MAAKGYEWDVMKMMGGFAVETTKSLTKDQLLKVPDHFNNNVLWNLGHLLYYQCNFFYGLTQQPFPLPAGCEEQYKELFADGTSPKTWKSQPDVAAVQAQFASLTETVLADAAAGKFDGFKTVELFPGMTLHNANETAAFHAVHLGMHIGAIGALKKLI
ncbi:MAG: DinB family protein [Candidatus Hydrogenedentes bacterium]|nr:DinB family protein [Candidatus Hydrogenedentota bacterium]